MLDCKVPEDQPIIEKLPSILDNLCEVCAPHFALVRAYLEDRGICYEVKPRLVRGLDYYMRTTFEVVHGNLGSQNSVLGGGRYDGLAESLGSSVPAPGIGFSIGEDRLVMTVDQGAAESLDIYMAPLGETALLHAGGLARDLRRSGVSVEVAANAKLKRAMELANKLGARYALILGDDEIAAGRYSLKNMQSGEQRRSRGKNFSRHFKRRAHLQNAHVRRTPPRKMWDPPFVYQGGYATDAITAEFTSSIWPTITAPHSWLSRPAAKCTTA